jgi:hypothetical protein
MPKFEIIHVSHRRKWVIALSAMIAASLLSVFAALVIQNKSASTTPDPPYGSIVSDDRETTESGRARKLSNGYPPLLKARSLGISDADFMDWIERVSQADDSSAVTEPMADELEYLLGKNSIDAISLSELALSFGGIPEGKPLEQLSNLRISLAAIDAAEREFPNFKGSHSKADVSRILWHLALQWNDTQYEEKCRIYALLVQFEPAHSANRLRAIYKYSSAMNGTGDHKAALKLIDGLLDRDDISYQCS